MKRSNRLILLIGIVLAIVAFVAIIVLFNGNGQIGTTAPSAPPTTQDTVVASVDIPLGTQVRADMLITKKIAIVDRLPGAVGDGSEVIGQIVRTDVKANAQITQSMFASTGLASNPGVLLPKGLRAQSVQVDQVTGVGTLISVGDRVDAVVGFGGGGCGSAFPVSTVDKSTGTLTPIPGLSTISVKLLLQSLLVVATELPPVAQTAQQPTASAEPGTALNGQQEIVIVAVSAQQSEVMKYAQIDGCISLLLRSPKDYVDDSGNPVEPPADPTTGIILKTLVDEYGVLPPEVVEGILPKK